MKITRRQLRQIINEELRIVTEVNTALHNIDLSKLPKLKKAFQRLVSTAEGQSVGKFVASAKQVDGKTTVTVDAGQTTTSKEHTAKLKNIFQNQMVLAYHRDNEIDKAKEYGIQLAG